MSVGFRVVAVAMMVTLLLAGPLAPLAAAQQPAPPAQPDVFKETMKSAPPPSEGDVQLNETFYDVAAGAATAVLVPGRVITCVAGAGLGSVLLLLTFGTAYKAFGSLLTEGCDGKWIVSGRDLMPEPPVVRSGELR